LPFTNFLSNQSLDALSAVEVFTAREKDELIAEQISAAYFAVMFLVVK
jgi:hypothetical protein